ncbi:MAG: hypothetical protein ABIO79_00370 [Ferruginibacter sp.]
MKTIKVKELEVPIEVIAEVAELLTDNDITNTITGVDEDYEILFMEMEYEKEDNQVIHDIEDVIEDFNEDDDEEKKLMYCKKNPD